MPITRGRAKALLAGFASGLAWAAYYSPTAALALGWGPDQVVTPKKTYTPAGIGEFARSFITGFLGLAVIVFVLKVVLTAVDRFIFVGSSNNGFRLDELPLIGAYRNPERDDGHDGGSAWTWPHIWGHFAIQVGLCAGAWVITEFLIRLISTVAQL